MKMPNSAYEIPEISISVKYKKSKADLKLYTVRTSSDVATFARMCFNADEIEWREEMVMICLNSQNEVCGYYKVSSGGISGTPCDPKVVFTVALNCCASSIIVAHNHPSGNLTPSEADRDITRRLKDAGKTLGISLLDHVIITVGSYYSFADNGAL
ncbi:JAB domain-containing protein [Spirosoma sp.]|uniref:JAB domain-containing protein n=1 Tax=Spirosoma sp. TaxID=1899569 RepID=UPI00260B8E2A|nr:JAB domain-containing protein [Spirosoma sp.]MCX6217672.1 JAB domain-containing protein [Spirosoma sp.]